MELKQWTKKGNKLTLVKITFSLKAYKNLSDREIEKLNDTATDFFYFILTLC